MKIKLKTRKTKYKITLHGSAWRWEEHGQISFRGPFMIREIPRNRSRRKVRG